MVCCRDAAMQFHLEAGHLCHFYYMAAAAAEHFDKVLQLSGLQVQLTGGYNQPFQVES